MADLNIFEPQVSVVSHGLEGKVITIYGTNNIGKTANAVRMKKPFVIACESGLGAQNNVKHFKVTSWKDFKTIIKQFTDSKTVEKAKEMYSTIIIDEVYASSLFCQKFVCDVYGDGCISLGTCANPKVNLYQIYERIYWEQINLLVSAGYTVVFIAHEDEKDGYIMPKGDKRCIKPILDNSDIVAYVRSNGVDEKGNVIKSSAYFAQTAQFFARSRYDYMTTYIEEFTVENLEKAIIDGIEAQAKAEGVASVSYEEQQEMYQVKKLSYEELMQEIGECGNKIIGKTGNVSDVTDIVEATLGVGKKVSECTRKQTEAMEIILDDLKALCTELGIN